MFCLTCSMACCAPVHLNIFPYFCSGCSTRDIYILVSWPDFVEHGYDVSVVKVLHILKETTEFIPVRRAECWPFSAADANAAMGIS